MRLFNYLVMILTEQIFLNLSQTEKTAVLQYLFTKLPLSGDIMKDNEQRQLFSTSFRSMLEASLDEVRSIFTSKCSFYDELRQSYTREHNFIWNNQLHMSWCGFLPPDTNLSKLDKRICKVFSDFTFTPNWTVKNTDWGKVTLSPTEYEYDENDDDDDDEREAAIEFVLQMKKVQNQKWADTFHLENRKVNSSNPLETRRMSPRLAKNAIFASKQKKSITKKSHVSSRKSQRLAGQKRARD